MTSYLKISQQDHHAESNSRRRPCLPYTVVIHALGCYTVLLHLTTLGDPNSYHSNRFLRQSPRPRPRPRPCHPLFFSFSWRAFFLRISCCACVSRLALHSFIFPVHGLYAYRVEHSVNASTSLSPSSTFRSDYGHCASQDNVLRMLPQAQEPRGKLRSISIDYRGHDETTPSNRKG